MQLQELHSVDDYEVFLTERMSLWSPQQWAAFAAAVAQSWLPAYEAFAAEESWGDPATLRRGLDARVPLAALGVSRASGQARSSRGSLVRGTVHNQFSTGQD